jgi:hypothetical protein
MAHQYDAALVPARGPTALHVQNPLAANNGPIQDLDTTLNLQNANWIQVNTGQILPAVPIGGVASPGIYTIGQWQCMCIALAYFANPAGPAPQWTQCFLTHVSHKNHSKVQDIIDELNNPANNGQAYVVIGSKAAMLGSMQEIGQRFLNAANPPAQVLIYSSAEQGNFRFGIRRDGLFGQVV